MGTPYNCDVVVVMVLHLTTDYMWRWRGGSGCGGDVEECGFA